jgi:hypothetical protein
MVESTVESMEWKSVAHLECLTAELMVELSAKLWAMNSVALLADNLEQSWAYQSAASMVEPMVD